MDDRRCDRLTKAFATSNNRRAFLKGLLDHAGAGAGKDKRPVWISRINDTRQIVSHASSGWSISLEQLAGLEEYDVWLAGQLSSPKTLVRIVPSGNSAE